MLYKRLDRHALILTIVLSLAGECIAQDPVPANAEDLFIPNRVRLGAFLKAARTTRMPQLGDLTQVKLVTLEGERRLVMMLEGFRVEKRAEMVTTFRNETKSRTVTDPQGRVTEQTFTVKVPLQEEREFEVKLPAGRKPVSKPASLFRFFDLNGEELSIEQASSKLPNLRAAFLLDRFAGELPELPELYREVISEDCLLITCEERIREEQAQPVFEALPARDLMPRAIER